MAITIPHGTPQWIYDGVDPQYFEDATATTFNRGPKHVQDNVNKLLSVLNSLQSSDSSISITYPDNDTINLAANIPSITSSNGSISITYPDNDTINLTSVIRREIPRTIRLNVTGSATFTLPPGSSVRVQAVAGGGGGGNITSYGPGGSPHPATNGGDTYLTNTTALQEIFRCKGGGRGQDDEAGIADGDYYDPNIPAPTAYSSTILSSAEVKVESHIPGQVTGTTPLTQLIDFSPTSSPLFGQGAAGLPGYINVSGSKNGASGSYIDVLVMNPYSTPQEYSLVVGSAGVSAGAVQPGAYGTNNNLAGAGCAVVTL